MKGELFVVATPIGNLGDMTHRAIDTLKSVDLVACEDTRRTQKLLNFFGLSKPHLRYDEHVHHQAARVIIERLMQGAKVALVTDAGTPTISDPGVRLVDDVLKAGFKVTPIPGASSPIAALSASGFGAKGFIFLGFLSRKPGPATTEIKKSLELERPIVIMESPFRVHKTLELIARINPQIQAVVARELTKLNEEFIRGTVQEVLDRIKDRELKGEVLILLNLKS